MYITQLFWYISNKQVIDHLKSCSVCGHVSYSEAVTKKAWYIVFYAALCKYYVMLLGIA